MCVFVWVWVFKKKLLFRAFFYSLNEQKVSIGGIGKGDQRATSTEIQDIRKVPIKKEKLELDWWKWSSERLLRETELQFHH